MARLSVFSRVPATKNMAAHRKLSQLSTRCRGAARPVGLKLDKSIELGGLGDIPSFFVKSRDLQPQIDMKFQKNVFLTVM